MSWNLLLNWMTHVGEGSWSLFRKTAGELAPEGADVQQLCRSLRITFSDLGHADFFIDGSQRWRTLPPILGGLAVQKQSSILLGGRTPKMVAALKRVTEDRDYKFEVRKFTDRPERIYLEGRGGVLASIAEECGITYVPRLAELLAQRLIPIPVKLQDAGECDAPVNWAVRSFDLESLTWVEGLLRHSACEFTSRYGVRRFFLHFRRGKMREMSKRDAVYASSMIQCVRFAQYSPKDNTLSTPLSAPLPEEYSRTACMCSGMPAELSGGRLVYREVPETIAAFLLVATGQPHPKFFSISQIVENTYGQPI